MRRTKILFAATWLVLLNGCFEEGGAPILAGHINVQVESLSAWAPTANLGLAHDTNLAPVALQSRWDSVVNLSKYTVQARGDLERIAADWASRNPTADHWTVIDSQTQKGRTTYLIRFSVEGVLQGGILSVPTSSKPKAVLLFGHPGDAGIDASYLSNLGLLLGNLDSQFVILAPAYRGETAIMGTKNVTSDILTQSPWDRDVDDGLAFLQGALDNVSLCDPSRIAAVGYSRGGGVSLLSALRDPRIQSVFEIAGPTDFFAPSLQKVAMGLLAGQPYDLPGLDYLNATFLQPFFKGTISADSLRRVLLERSPARWALSGRLPATQAIHGSLDSTVFPDQSKALLAADSRVTYTEIQGMNHSSFLINFLQGGMVATDLQNFLKAHVRMN